MRFIRFGLPALFLALTACDEPPAPEAPPTEVFVVTASEQPYQPGRTFTARMESRSDVNITAQVTGKLVAVHFREGDVVEAGAPLFDIDPAPYKAALSQAKAERDRARANLSEANSNLTRASKLIDKGYISDSEYDTLQSRKQEAQAAAKSAEAALESAQVDLSYTHIAASQAGRVARSVASVGDVVSPSFGTLTTLVGQGNMQAVFQIPERLLTEAATSPDQPELSEIEVGLVMPDGSTYPQTGNIVYVSNRVAINTGTVEVRAAMPNPNDLLRPGMFVQAQVRLKESIQGLMLPQAALQVDQQGTYVFAVNEQDTVIRLNLQTGERIGENVLVDDGLPAGTRVILRGIQKVRPGSVVTATAFKPATQAHEGSPDTQAAQDAKEGATP
ncbi:efflux RND transporter periplasmic adaptor subunit [Alcanivorax sp.]|uniref:efflux RND transporter periplasmic adaptor subunit n=1 Tax=Alcanivorax sp. TaxID=1872427 RepID=UPI0032D98EE8